MNSPFVTKLLATLEGEADSERRALLMADLACYWARVGEFEAAEKIRQELRRDFGDAKSVRVSILIMVIEALQLYYKDLSPGARDRMLRASLLSKGFRERRLISLTSAWMAHIEFNGASFASMSGELQTSLREMEPGDDPIDCRVSLVLGDAFLLSGMYSESQAWYDRARRAANRLGDRAALGAMTYNRAALRVARARYERLRGGNLEVDSQLLRLDVESAINYQHVAHLKSLDHLLTTAKAGLLLIQDKHAAALPIIRDLLESEEVAPATAQRTLLSADCAYVLAKTGAIDHALSQLELVLSSMPDHLPTDDLCLILGSLRAASIECKRSSQAADLEDRLQLAIAKHEAVISELRGILSTFVGLAS